MDVWTGNNAGGLTQKISARLPQHFCPKLRFTMIQRIMASWDRLARQDPLWAILTSDDKAGQRWDADEFFRTGVADVETVLARVRQLGLTPQSAPALDFGCGVGRLTRALATHFPSADGVDVSGVMIEKAKTIRDVPANVRFIHNPRADLSALAANHYGFVLSLISLQHMPEAAALRYLRGMCECLRPGGVGYTQVITFLDTRDGRAAEKLRRDESKLNRAYRSVAAIARAKPPRMDTYYCRLSKITELLEKSRMRLVAVLPDSSAPAPFVSHVVVFQKPE